MVRCAPLLLRGFVRSICWWNVEEERERHTRKETQAFAIKKKKKKEQKK
jgi:hypothetical protein